MRLQTLACVILFLAFILTRRRDPAGRVGVLVFFTGVGEVALGLAAVMALFRTVGAICEAVVLALLGEIDGTPSPRLDLSFRPELIVRSSTGPVPTS